MRIYIVRHGETEWNRVRRFQGRIDLPLNQEGRKKVRALAFAQKNAAFNVICKKEDRFYVELVNERSHLEKQKE